MIVEINNFSNILVDGHKYSDLAGTRYFPLKEMEKYLEFIRELIINYCDGTEYENNYEIQNLIYNSFIYFLTNWDNVYHSNQIPFNTWYMFKKSIDEILKTEKNAFFILNQESNNIDYFRMYLDKLNGNIKIKNKNIVMSKIMENFQGTLILIYFLVRKMILNKKIKNNDSKVMFLTDYDRYYGNNRFFGVHLFEDREFKTLLKDFNLFFSGENVPIMFTKYNYSNIFQYIKKYHKKDANYLFIEDILNFKIGLKTLAKCNTYGPIPCTHYADENKEFINEMFKNFLKNKFSIVLWYYRSIKDHILKNDIKLVVGDSEKNFMFYLFNICTNWMNIGKTIAFSHELINEEYGHIPVSNNYKNIPDCKLVWNKNVKNLLINKYNFPENIIKVFPDPRFLYWKKYSRKEKAILFVSQGYPNFYQEIFKIFEDKELINDLVNEKYLFYFKPHPAEFFLSHTQEYVKKLNQLQNIMIINDINFIPEYTIGMSSTLVYELLNVGSKAYFLDENAKKVFLFEKNEFKKYYRSNLKDIFSELLFKS